MTAPETLIVPTEKLFCDGGNDVSGHPRVYLTMNAVKVADCPYCGRHFVLDPQAVIHDGH